MRQEKAMHTEAFDNSSADLTHSSPIHKLLILLLPLLAAAMVTAAVGDCHWPRLAACPATQPC